MTRDSLLWLTEEIPAARTGGGGLRQEGLLVELGRRVPIDLVVCGGQPSREVADAVRHVVSLPARETPSRIDRAKTAALAWVRGDVLPDVAGAEAVRRRILATLTERPHWQEATATVVIHLPLAPLLDRVPGTRVFHPFHVASAQLTFEAEQANGLRARRLRRYAANAARLEAWAVRTADLTVTVCEDDARLFGSTATAVVPNAVDPTRYADLGPPAEDPVVLFPASLGYDPNVDGARWLATEVWPHVRRARRDARLLLVGKAPTPAVHALAAGEGVEVHGDVPDMAPWFERARVIAVPLRYGTGTRLKALEAMASGRPVVGTGIGLEGFGIVDGRHARIADDPGDFAAALVELLASGGHDLAAAGRALVHEHYTWPVVADRFLEALDRTTSAAQ